MYFALITFHALHVLAGVVVLAINLLRAHLGDFSARNYAAVQVGNWFWYYVTAVWIVLFTKDLVVQMDPGHYVVVCNQPGHYSQGMYLNFEVK